MDNLLYNNSNLNNNNNKINPYPNNNNSKLTNLIYRKVKIR